MSCGRCGILDFETETLRWQIECVSSKPWYQASFADCETHNSDTILLELQQLEWEPESGTDEDFSLEKGEIAKLDWLQSSIAECEGYECLKLKAIGRKNCIQRRWNTHENILGYNWNVKIAVFSDSENLKLHHHISGELSAMKTKYDPSKEKQTKVGITNPKFFRFRWRLNTFLILK